MLEKFAPENQKQRIIYVGFFFSESPLYLAKPKDVDMKILKSIIDIKFQTVVQKIYINNYNLRRNPTLPGLFPKKVNSLILSFLKNIPVVLPNSPIKMWVKSIQGLRSYAAYARTS